MLTRGQRSIHTLGTLIHNLPSSQGVVPHLQAARWARQAGGQYVAGIYMVYKV